jgi:hypothetical protein
MTRGPRYGTVVSWDAEVVHRRDALPVHYMVLVLQLQDQVLTLIHDSLSEMVEASGSSYKSYLWDQFLRNKAESLSNDDVQFSMVHAFSLSPVISLETIIVLAQTRSEDHEDTLVATRSDKNFSLEEITVPSQPPGKVQGLGTSGLV